MATNVTLNHMQTAFPNGQTAPVFDPDPVVAEDIASSGTSQQSTGAAPSQVNGMIWRIASDTAVWAAFGANPTASTGTSHLVVAGGEIHVAAKPGHKVAVINA